MVILSFVCGAPVLADDGHVSQSTLAALGLGGVVPASDIEAMQVRGMGGGVFTQGLSLVSGLLIDRNLKSFVSGSDANHVHVNAEQVCLQVRVRAEHVHSSRVGFDLQVATPSRFYVGALYGITNGYGLAVSP
jgi:hypothetical protein